MINAKFYDNIFYDFFPVNFSLRFVRYAYGYSLTDQIDVFVYALVIY